MLATQDTDLGRYCTSALIYVGVGVSATNSETVNFTGEAILYNCYIENGLSTIH